MALEFTKLTEVEKIEEPVAEAAVIVEDEGSIKRTPMKNIGKVKTVNGAEPDEEGNVEIEIPKITIIQDGYDDAAMGVAAAVAEAFTCTANATFAEVMQMMQTKTVPPIELYYCGFIDAVIGHAEGGSINLTTDTEGTLALEVYFNLSTICYRVVWTSADEITVGVWS